MFKFYINKLYLSGSGTVTIEHGSTFILIGPNNSGKSTALSEMEWCFMAHRGKVFDRIDWMIEGSNEEFVEWLEENHSFDGKFDEPHFVSGGPGIATREGGIVSKSGAISLFERMKSNEPFNSILNCFLYRRLDAMTRFDLVKPVGILESWHKPPTHYIHMLQYDEEAMKDLSSEVKRAFMQGLVIDRGGPRLAFRVGEEPQRSLTRDRASKEYQSDLDKLPLLQEEGDGIRSYVGILLEAKCGAHPVLMIDEPEAFLHPPQARRLGRVLARSAEEQHRQVIIATHSSDVLRGALDASSKVAVCRLVREGSVNHAVLLSSERIKELWSKPLLRSVAALDGVFHQGVVISEADSDSRFYEALVRRLEAKGEIEGPADYYFIHGGGKGELVTLASAYRGLDVRLSVVADLDMLRTKNEFVILFTALGGDFGDISGLYNSVISELNRLPPIKSPATFVREARAILVDVEAKCRVDSSHRKELGELICDAGDWSEAKKYGLLKLTGGALKAGKKLLAECKKVGLFLVPNGQLEGWWREGPVSNKPKWIGEALDLLNEETEDFTEASVFIKEIVAFLENKGPGTLHYRSK